MRNVRGKVPGRRHENLSLELLSFAGNFHNFLCENFSFISWRAIRKAGPELRESRDRLSSVTQKLIVGLLTTVYKVQRISIFSWESQTSV